MYVHFKLPFPELRTVKKTFLNRYCRQVLCETVRTAKLTPVSARLQDIEGKIDKFIIPREVGNIWYT